MADSAASITAPELDRDDVESTAIAERLRRCVETVSLGFAGWDDPPANGPGLYFVVERDDATVYTEPMGANHWPVEDCPSVFASPSTLCETAGEVASACDGAVVVHNDGTFKPEMVRMRQLSASEREQTDGLPYAGWMGARHMSALETSTREEIRAVVTLSEEDGRLTTFSDGTFEDTPRGEMRTGWQFDD